MKIKKEHLEKTIEVLQKNGERKKYVLAELTTTQVKQYVAAGYLDGGYIQEEEKKPRKKKEIDYKGIEEGE